MGNEKSKTYFWILLDVLLATAVVNLVFFVMPTIKKWGDSFYPVRTITISAEGKTIVTPDIAELSFGVTSRGSNPQTIVDANNKKVSAAIDYVKSQGVDAKDVKTIGYNLSPDYRYDPDTGQSSITGYTLNQTVHVKIRDLNKVAPLISGLTPLGVNNISGPMFTVEDPEKFLGDARADGFAKAKAKAQSMASQSGVALGRILNVGEYAGGYPVPYYTKAADMAGGFGAQATPSVPSIEPGSDELTVTVSITYALE